MTENRVQLTSLESAEEKKTPAVMHKKKKTSWLRTILWMVSMMLLVNIIMAAIGYLLIHYKII